VPEAPMFHVTLVPCLLFHSAFLTSFHFSLHGPFLQVFVPTMLDSLWWDVPSELSTIKGVSMTFSLLSQECSAEIAKFTCSARLKVGQRRACESIRSYPFLLLPLTPPRPPPHGPTVHITYHISLPVRSFVLFILHTRMIHNPNIQTHDSPAFRSMGSGCQEHPAVRCVRSSPKFVKQT
jgi:hypothetical protein